MASPNPPNLVLRAGGGAATVALAAQGAAPAQPSSVTLKNFWQNTAAFFVFAGWGFLSFWIGCFLFVLWCLKDRESYTLLFWVAAGVALTAYAFSLICLVLDMDKNFPWLLVGLSAIFVILVLVLGYYGHRHFRRLSDYKKILNELKVQPLLEAIDKAKADQALHEATASG